MRLRERLIMLALALPIAFYVIRIGGDPRHYRYLAFPFCLCVCAGAGLIEQVLARFPIRGRRVIGAVAAILIAAGSLTRYPWQLSAHPFFGDETCEITNKINDASDHRHKPSLALSPWSSGAETELRDEYREYLQRVPDGGHIRLAVQAWCVTLYERFSVRFVHTLGLTDPILAHTEMPADRPAHKLGLAPLAVDLARITESNDNTPRRGMYRDAVRSGRAPYWIEKNLDSIEIIERKMFNEHHFFENLRLAFTFPDRICVSDDR